MPPRIADYRSLSRKYKDKNVLVFGMNDEEVKVHGCYSIPTVMVIDPSGKIVAHSVGERPESELVAALKQAGMN